MIFTPFIICLDEFVATASFPSWPMPVSCLEWLNLSILQAHWLEGLNYLLLPAIVADAGALCSSLHLLAYMAVLPWNLLEPTAAAYASTAQPRQLRPACCTSHPLLVSHPNLSVCLTAPCPCMPPSSTAEAGFGGPLNAFELTKHLIEAGAAGGELIVNKLCFVQRNLVQR
jgi:hypothetical protein